MSRAESARVAERSISIDGCTIRFSQAGQGPAMALVHGLLGYSFSWRFAVALLAPNREVFALDMPGSGLSGCPGNLDARLSAAALRLSKFLDAIGLDKCDLVGSSYGGTTALRLATLQPARIRTLTLVAPANPWSQIGRRRLTALRSPGVAWAFPRIARRVRPLHKFFVRRMFGDPSRVTRETLDGYSVPLMRRGVFEHALKIAKSWDSDMQELERDLPRAAAVPTLLVWGSKDRLVDFKSAEILRQQFRTATTVVIEGAGHLPYEEAPEAFCGKIEHFLQTHSPAQVLDGK